MNTLVLEAPAPVARSWALPSRSTILWANGVALVAAAVFLRCWHLGNIPGINGDEAWSGVQALKVARGEAIGWLTPTGNPLNPFFMLPQIGLHYFFPPSITLLRLTPLVSGLAALVVNYVLCRRVFDQRTALLSTMLLALLPIDIAYSRFAWDASQSLVVTLFVLYLPLAAVNEFGNRAPVTAPAMCACIAAIFVHPTNAFALALLIVPALYVRRASILQRLRDTRIPAKTLWLAALVAVSVTTAYLILQGVSGAGRLHGPSQLGPFAENYLRLFSGSTIYEYVSGAGASGTIDHYTLIARACDLVFGLVAIAALAGLAQRLAHSRNAVDGSLVAAWFVMLAGFFLVAGPKSIGPHFERYGICLIGPGALVVARGLGWWLDACRPHAKAISLALAAAAWLWPASFYLDYFDYFEQTGGSSHDTFRTAVVEPKAAALSFIVAQQPEDATAVIVCRQWWNYWPLAYLADSEANIRVLTWDEWQLAGRENDAPRSEDVWYVEFADSADEAEARRALAEQGSEPRCHVLRDYAGRSVVSVIGPLENDSQNY